MTALTSYKPKEKDIVHQIIDWLELNKYFYWRNNTGAFSYTADSGRKGFYRFGDKGSPDIFAVRQAKCLGCETDCGCKVKPFGQIYGIEVKVSKGKQSLNQQEWQVRFEQAGGKYILARSLDDVMKII